MTYDQVYHLERDRSRGQRGDFRVIISGRYFDNISRDQIQPLESANDIEQFPTG